MGRLTACVSRRVRAGQKQLELEIPSPQIVGAGAPVVRPSADHSEIQFLVKV